MIWNIYRQVWQTCRKIRNQEGEKDLFKPMHIFICTQVCHLCEAVIRTNISFVTFKAYELLTLFLFPKCRYFYETNYFETFEYLLLTMKFKTIICLCLMFSVCLLCVTESLLFIGSAYRRKGQGSVCHSVFPERGLHRGVPRRPAADHWC